MRKGENVMRKSLTKILNIMLICVFCLLTSVMVISGCKQPNVDKPIDETTNENQTLNGVYINKLSEDDFSSLEFSLYNEKLNKEMKFEVEAYDNETKVDYAVNVANPELVEYDKENGKLIAKGVGETDVTISYTNGSNAVCERKVKVKRRAELLGELKYFDVKTGLGEKTPTQMGVIGEVSKCWIENEDGDLGEIEVTLNGDAVYGLTSNYSKNSNGYELLKQDIFFTTESSTYVIRANPYGRVIRTAEDFIDAFSIKTYFNEDFNKTTHTSAELKSMAIPNNSINWLKNPDGSYLTDENGKYIPDYSNCLNKGYYILANDIDMAGYDYVHEVYGDYISVMGLPHVYNAEGKDTLENQNVFGLSGAFCYNNRKYTYKKSNTYDQDIGFMGIFDGQGYTVSNLNIPNKVDMWGLSKSTQNGIFGLINPDSVIKNVAFIDAKVDNYNGSNSGLFSAFAYDCEISNVYVKLAEGSTQKCCFSRSMGNVTFNNVILDFSNNVVNNLVDSVEIDGVTYNYTTKELAAGSLGTESFNGVSTSSKNLIVISELPFFATNDTNVALTKENVYNYAKGDAYNINEKNKQFPTYDNYPEAVKSAYKYRIDNICESPSVLRFATKKAMMDGMLDCNVDLSAFNNDFWKVEYYTPLWHTLSTNDLYELKIKADGENLNQDQVIELNYGAELKLNVNLTFKGKGVTPTVTSKKGYLDIMQNGDEYVISAKMTSGKVAYDTIQIYSKDEFSGLTFENDYRVLLFDNKVFIDNTTELNVKEIIGSSKAVIESAESDDGSGVTFRVQGNKLIAENLGVEYYTVDGERQGIKDYGYLGKRVIVKLTATYENVKINKTIVVIPVTKVVDSAEEFKTIFAGSGSELINNLRVGYYALTSDIDMSGVEYKQKKSYDPWAKMPTNAQALKGGFQGILDGYGHTVSNLKTNNTIFNGINYETKIRNIAFVNVGSLDEKGSNGLFARRTSNTSEFNNVYIKFDTEMAVSLATVCESYYNNVIIDFTNHGEIKLDVVMGEKDGRTTELNATNYLGMSNYNDFPYTKSEFTSYTKNLFVISDLPFAIKPSKVDEKDENGKVVRTYADGKGGFIADAFNITADKRYQVPESITDHEKYQTINVKNASVLRFENQTQMQTYLTENVINLEGFNNYWTITNGVPVWKGIN